MFRRLFSTMPAKETVQQAAKSDFESLVDALRKHPGTIKVVGGVITIIQYLVYLQLENNNKNMKGQMNELKTDVNSKMNELKTDMNAKFDVILNKLEESDKVKELHQRTLQLEIEKGIRERMEKEKEGKTRWWFF